MMLVKTIMTVIIKQLIASVYPQAVESHRAANNLAERANVEHGQGGMKLDRQVVAKLVNGCAARTTSPVRA